MLENICVLEMKSERLAKLFKKATMTKEEKPQTSNKYNSPNPTFPKTPSQKANKNNTLK